MKRLKHITTRMLAILLSGTMIISNQALSVLAAVDDLGSTETIFEESQEEVAGDSYNAEVIEDPSEEMKDEVPEEPLEGKKSEPDNYSEPAEGGADQSVGETSDQTIEDTVISYTVTLDANGGHFENEWDDALRELLETTEILTKVIPVGEAVSTIPVYGEDVDDDQTGIFLGWSLEKDSEFAVKTDYIPTGDCTLFAVWDIEEAATEEAGDSPDAFISEEKSFTDEEQSLDYSQTDPERNDEEQGSTEDVNKEVVNPEEAKKSTEQETVIEKPGNTVIVSTPAVNGSYKEGDKLLTLGEEGTITQYPQNPKRTNGFDDYRVDVSSYEAQAYTLDKEEREIYDIRANGEYQELNLQFRIPEGENVWGLVNDDANVIRYDIQGPNIKKVLKKKAYDKEIFIGYGSGRLGESGGSDEFRFDQVCSERIAARLHVPYSNFAIQLHSSIYYRLLNYEVEELRQYDSASEFVKSTGFMQSDDIYKDHLGTERRLKNYEECREKYKGNIHAYCKGKAQERHANGYESIIVTKYANCIGIKENSNRLKDFQEKINEGIFSFCIKEGDTYWFAFGEYDSAENLSYWCAPVARNIINKYFPGMDASEYEVRAAAAFDELEYYLYYDFTVKDVCDAWLAEMNNWEGHWIHCLYGVYDRNDIGKTDAEPGLYDDSWGSPGVKTGKTTLHFPDQYTYYVRDPGVYTITATIDDCNGTIKSQFVVGEEEKKISSAKITLSDQKFIYDGKEKMPGVSVTYKNKRLVENNDYVIIYYDNVNAGTATVEVHGIGDYTGKANKTFEIAKTSQTLTARAANPNILAGNTTMIFTEGAKENGNYTFTSLNTSVAKVSADGKVTGCRPGEVYIVVTANETNNYKKASKRVLIKVSLKKPGNCHFVKWNNSNYTSCRIAWNKVAGADGYQTLLSWTDGSHASSTIVKSNVFFRDCTVHPQHVSQMKVRAFWMKNGERKYGPWSNVEYITPSPTKLTYRNASSGNNLEAKISWNTIYGCNGYNVFITMNPNGTWYWNQSTSTKATSTSAAITKFRGSRLKKNTRYYVRIVTRRKRNGVFCTVPMPVYNTRIGSFVIR